MELLRLSHQQWQSSVLELLQVAEPREVSEDPGSPYKVFTPVEHAKGQEIGDKI